MTTVTDRYAALSDGEIWDRICGSDSPRDWTTDDVEPYMDDAQTCEDLTPAERDTVSRALTRCIEVAS